MSSIGKTKKKRGRPATGRDPSVTIRLPADLLSWIDREAGSKQTGRSDMIRRLIEESRLGVPEHLARLRTAFHEAGHAVVARALGLPIDHVTILPTERSLGHVQNGESVLDTHVRLNIENHHRGRGYDSESARCSHIMMLMAGREAEQMVLGFHHPTGGDRHDRRLISRFAKPISPVQYRKSILDNLRSATMWMVMKDFPKSITQVARALLTAKTLDQKRVDKIIAATGERSSKGRRLLTPIQRT